jgi:hypothetical protein
MSSSRPPALKRSTDSVDSSSVADVIEWFIKFDPRVAAINHSSVDELFRYRKASSQQDYPFDRAEDRLAVGIYQSLVENKTEQELHAWIKELITALDDLTKTNESISDAYNLQSEESVMARAEKIPTEREREIYLNSCWLETLCTAEARVLGWIYQELYQRAFHPNNF